MWSGQFLVNSRKPLLLGALSLVFCLAFYALWSTDGIDEYKPSLPAELYQLVLSLSFSLIVLLVAFFLFFYARMKKALSQSENKFNKVTCLLNKSERHLQAVLDGTYDGIICIDQTGLITDFNQGAKNILGYSSAEAVGEHINLIIPDNEKAEHSRFVANADVSKKKVVGKARQLYGRHKDGSLVPVEVTLNRVVEEGRNKFVGVIRDVSELTIERNNLVDALSSAQQANDAKTRLLSLASHELRTPLNAIMGFSELLISDNESVSRKQRLAYLRDIHSSAELLLMLVNDVLDYAKLDSGRMTLEFKAVDLKALIINSVRMSKADFSLKNLNYQVRCENDLWVRADQLRLQQVLLNLLSNACKYNCSEGGIEIIAKADTETSQVRVEVRDSGIGIAPEKQNLLFKPFERLHDSQLDIEGTGLGLSICKSMIEQMGGQIGYEANSGCGSIFYLVLPASSDRKTICDVPNNAEATEPSIVGLSVLYVEDNEVNIRLMAAIMDRLGVSMKAITSAEEAFEYLKNQRPDIILMDINLPGMSGQQAAREIRKLPHFQRTPIVAVSASIDGAMAGNEGVFDGLLGKPFKLDQIRKLVESYSFISYENSAPL